MARTDQPHKLSFDVFVSAVTDPANPLNEKHANLDYSKPETRASWNGSKSKIPIWCNVHEEFFVQMAANHRSLGQGCPKCGKQTYKDKRRKQDPVAYFREKHGDLYDYSLVDYVNVHTKFPAEVRERYDFSRACYTHALEPITGIVCLDHGELKQYSAQLRKSGAGCPACGDVVLAPPLEGRGCHRTVHVELRPPSRAGSHRRPAEGAGHLRAVG